MAVTVVMEELFLMAETVLMVVIRSLLQAARVAPAIMRVTGAEGFNLFLNNGSVAGQVVPHAHLHILPRLVNDGVLVQAAAKAYEGPAAMQAMAAAISAKVKV